MRRFFFSLFSFFLLTLCFSPSPVQAQSVEATQAIARPTFLLEETIILQENVPGTVFAAGGEVEILGDVAGDLVVAGGSVRVRGVVTGDIYVAGGSVFLENAVGGNVVAAGAEIRTLPTASLSGTLMVAGSRFEHRGTVLNDLWAGTSQALLFGKVQGNARVNAAEITESPDFSVMGSKNLTQETAAEKPQQSATDQFTHVLTTFMFAFLWQGMLLGAIWYFAPMLLKQGSLVLTQHPVRTFFDGITVLVLGLITAFLFIIFVFGTPLSLSILATLIALSSTAWIFLPLWIGQKILPAQSQKWQLVAGLGVLSLATSAPLLGWVASLLAVLWGLGAWWQVLTQMEDSTVSL